MNSSSERQSKIGNVVSWLAIVLISAMAFFVTYYYTFSGPVLSMVWIGWLVLTLILGYWTTKGRLAYRFAKEAKIELQKVVWPSRQETVQTTAIVMIMVCITGFVLWGVDSGMMWSIGKITHLG